MSRAPVGQGTLNCAHQTLAGWAAATMEPSRPVPVARQASLHTWEAYEQAIQQRVLRDDWCPSSNSSIGPESRSRSSGARTTQSAKSTTPNRWQRTSPTSRSCEFPGEITPCRLINVIPT